MMTGVVWAALASYLLMCVAYLRPTPRSFHVPVMVFTVLFDAGMPFYLYATRDWYKRLIEEGDITSFGIWMHLGLVLTLYALYVVQVRCVRAMVGGDATARSEHRGQGKAILVVRGLVLLMGGLLAESPK